MFSSVIPQLKSDILAFTLCKTKAEKYIFSELGFMLETPKIRTNYSIDHIELEYTRSSIGVQRADMAVLYTTDAKRVDIIEGKQQYTFDAVSATVFDKAGIPQKIQDDQKKISGISDNHFIKKYFFLFLVHYDALEVPDYFAYASKHHQVAISYSDSLSIKKDAINYVSNYLEQVWNKPEVLETNLGSYMNIPIKLITFINELN